MKRHWTLLFLGISTLLLGGCEKEWYDEYLIVNATDYDIVIKAFDTEKSTTEADEVIHVPAKGKYSVLKGLGVVNDYQGVFYNGGLIDSVTINFENNRIIIQSCDLPYGTAGTACLIERSIMNQNDEDNFVKTKRGKSSGQTEYTHTYTFTQEDYDNATLIE